MADPNEVFRTIQDTSGVGDALAEAVNATTDPTGLKGSIGFSFKDSAGKVILPVLDSAGKLPVSFDSGTEKQANGELAAGSTSLVDVTGATLLGERVRG